VVMVAMVDGQFTQVVAIELARTPAAYPGVHFERPFAIIIFPRAPLTMSTCNDLVQFIL
jgi:hypothetical protein